MISNDSWFIRNVSSLKTTMRIIFGMFWAIDGILKFGPVHVQDFPSMINDAASGQPSWLKGWFLLWSSIASWNPEFFVYGTGVAEVALSICMILGLFRKPAYVFGFFLSLVIWTVPEGFGGPYGPSSTDIGSGIVYALAFVMLMIISAAFGPSKHSLDIIIEKRWTKWKKIVEFKSS